MIHGIFLMHRIYPWFQGDLNRLLYFCQRGNWNQGKGKCKSWRFPVKLLLEWYPGQKRQKKKPKHPKIARTSFLGGLCDNLKNFPFEDEASLHNLWAFLSDDNTIGVNLLYHLYPTFLATQDQFRLKILLLQLYTIFHGAMDWWSGVPTTCFFAISSIENFLTLLHSWLMSVPGKYTNWHYANKEFCYLFGIF